MRHDFLDQLERQLVDATERGAKRRRFWHGRLRLRVPTFAGVAVAVTAVTATALAAGLGVLPAGHAKHTVKPSTPAVRSLTSAGPVPAEFSPDSFTAISEFTWWLLGTSPCEGHLCTTVVRTQDGGRSFTRIAAPSVGYGYQVRFADARDGYVFGDQLWTTHDGGASWRRVRLGGEVVDVAASGPYVYAIVWQDGQTGRLMRSQVDGDHWTTLRGAGYAYTGLWAQGSDVLLDSGSRPGLGGQLRISYDDGARFVTYNPPSAGPCQFQEAPPEVIWSQCGRPPGGEAPGGGIWRSTDAGAAFGAAAGEGIDNPDAVFSGASPTVAVLGYQQLYRTTDGGVTYSEVPTPKGVRWWDYLGFTDSTHGVALGTFRGGNRLYYTIDGGASYHYVPIDPT